jgi:orotate phosphoribosyltransferase
MSFNKTEFINFLINHQALKFGQFTLKSGRNSPYFFNLGVFHSGASISQLGEFYAQALQDSAIEFDVLFGPAYKGISLATATSIAFYQQHQLDIPYAFNRKEAKQHGDGGTIVGASLIKQRAIMLDDVITAGTTVRETLELMEAFNASLSGIVIAFDRQERGESNLSATQEVTQKTGIPIISLITLNDLITYLSNKAEYQNQLKAIQEYQMQFGC